MKSIAALAGRKLAPKKNAPANIAQGTSESPTFSAETLAECKRLGIAITNRDSAILIGRWGWVREFRTVAAAQHFLASQGIHAPELNQTHGQGVRS